MLYTQATIITMNPSRTILTDGAILVQGSIIAAIGKTQDLTTLYPDEERTPLAGRIIIPGLINTHIHTAQTLLRGTADDLSLVSWLCERIWPLQGNFTPEDGAAAARLSIAEMLKSGTTTFLESMFADRYGFDGLCEAVEQSGIRGCLGKIVMDVGTYAADPKWAMHPGLIESRETSLLGAVAMHSKWNGKANDRIRVWFGARTPGGVSPSLYKEMASLSKSKNIPITMHCAESPADTTFFASQPTSHPSEGNGKGGHTAMSYCSSLSLLGPTTVLVHMVHLTPSDISTLSATDTHVVHCPTSNTKLASGICPLPSLLSEKVNVSLGTDGAPCNNTCDMLREMHLTGIIHKLSPSNTTQHNAGDPTLIPAETVLEMATLHGARALSLQNTIGSLETGKKADFVALDFRAVHLQPWFNPVSAVVYSATGRDVEMVVVDGKEVVVGGKLMTMDEEAVWQEGERRAKQVVERAGLGTEAGARWPVE